MASHWSDTPTSPRAILHHTDTILCTFMHTTVPVVVESISSTTPMVGSVNKDLCAEHPSI